MMRNVVAIVSDSNFFGAAAFVVDQLARLNPPPGTDILLASDSAGDIEKARAFSLPCALTLLDPELAPASFPEHDHITRAAYYRVSLPKLLAEHYDRILYLDADVYVHGPRVFDLLKLDLQGNAVAGVRDCWVSVLDQPPGEAGNTIRNRERKYLNTGMMLIDIATFNKADLRSRVFRAVERAPQKMRFLDQSALNIVLDGSWLELSPAFNTTPFHWETFVHLVCDPVISHFAGPEKPWHGPRFTLDHPARPEIERFLARSPWSSLLARHFNFQDAWTAASGPAATAPVAKKLKADSARRLAGYLRSTHFADVAQGISELRLDLLPSGL